MSLSFETRVGRLVFMDPTPRWGYLPQILEAYGPAILEWELERAGPDHMPMFLATPICS